MLILCGCSDRPDHPLRVAIHPWIGYQSLTLCQQNNSLDKKLVELVKNPSVSSSSRMIQKNQVDAAALTLDEVLFLRDQGVPLTIVLVFDTSAGADLLLARPEIKTLHDLKGKTIGMENSALGNLMLNEILHRAELEPAQVNLHYGIVSEHVLLWKNNKLDALITYIPLPEELDNKTQRLFDSREIPNVILDVLAVRTDRLKEYDAALRHLLQNHFGVVDGMRSRYPDTLHRLATVLNTSTESTATILSELTFPSLAYNSRWLSPNSQDFGNSVKKLAQIMLPARLLTNEPDMKGLTDNSYLPD
jgi:NitT/TauT family transport system substrate-binding protein